MKDLNFNAENEHRELSALFSRLDSLVAEPSPYLATRVLARAKEQKRLRSRLRLWQGLSFGLVGACAVAVVFLTQFRSGEKLEALVGKPQVVMVKMQELADAPIASAEIELPEGVFFFSEAFPGLKEKRQLKLAWSQATDKPYLPFVVKGENPGTKVVMVKFRDRDGRLVTEREIKIHFVRGQS